MKETHASTDDHHEPGQYEIRLKGHLAARWAAWFDGLSLGTKATAPPPSTGRLSTRPRCMDCSRKCATWACHWFRSVALSLTKPLCPPPRVKSRSAILKGTRHDKCHSNSSK